MPKSKKRKYSNNERMTYLLDVVLHIELDSVFTLVITPLNVRVTGNWYIITLYDQDCKDIYGDQYQSINIPFSKSEQRDIDEFGEMVKMKQLERKNQLESEKSNF